MKHAYFLVFMTSSLFFACQNSHSTGGSNDGPPQKKPIDLNEMAETLCECMQPLFSIQNQINTLKKEGKTEELKTLLASDTLRVVTKKGDECVEQLEAIYGAVPEGDEPKANAAFKKVCPEVAALLEQGE